MLLCSKHKQSTQISVWSTKTRQKDDAIAGDRKESVPGCEDRKVHVKATNENTLEMTCTTAEDTEAGRCNVVQDWEAGIFNNPPAALSKTLLKQLWSKLSTVASLPLLSAPSWSPPPSTPSASPPLLLALVSCLSRWWYPALLLKLSSSRFVEKQWRKASSWIWW